MTLNDGRNISTKVGCGCGLIGLWGYMRLENSALTSRQRRASPLQHSLSIKSLIQKRKNEMHPFRMFPAVLVMRFWMTSMHSSPWPPKPWTDLYRMNSNLHLALLFPSHSFYVMYINIWYYYILIRPSRLVNKWGTRLIACSGMHEQRYTTFCVWWHNLCYASHCFKPFLIKEPDLVGLQEWERHFHSYQPLKEREHVEAFVRTSFPSLFLLESLQVHDHLRMTSRRNVHAPVRV